MYKMNGQQFLDIAIWQDETFGQTTAHSKTCHLREEVEELIEDIENDNQNRRLEYADCFILLFGAAASDGMSYEQICSAINEKMQINYTRKWGKPDDNGVVKHLK